MNARKLLLFVALPMLAVLFVIALALSGHHKTAKQTNSSTKSPSSTSSSNSKTSTTPQSSTSSSSTIDSAAATDDPTHDAISNQVSDGGTYQNGTFTISSTSEPVAGWVIAQVQPDSSSSGATVLLRRNSSGPMTVIAGPGTSFAKSILDQFNVPTAVQEQLLVYNDEQ